MAVDLTPHAVAGQAAQAEEERACAALRTARGKLMVAVLGAVFAVLDDSSPGDELRAEVDGRVWTGKAPETGKAAHIWDTTFSCGHEVWCWGGGVLCVGAFPSKLSWTLPERLGVSGVPSRGACRGRRSRSCWGAP
jgi:hypothetical protein